MRPSDPNVVRGTMVSSAILLAPAAIAAYAWAGLPGLTGATMGIALGCFSIVSFGLLASLMSPNAVKRSTPSKVVLLWLIKLPLIWLVVAAVVRIGSGATTCFLVALGLVYFALVHRAMLSAKA